MAGADTSLRSTLTDRVLDTLGRVGYRRALPHEDRTEIFRIRYKAYLNEGAIEPHPSELFSDEVDDAENTFLFAVTIDGELAGSIRLSVTLPGATDLPTAHVFPEYVRPEIEADKIVVDPTRFVAVQHLSRRFPELPYIILRLPWLAMDYFEADLMLAAVRPEHEPFYRRMWGNRLACPARKYPNLAKPVSLSILDYASARDAVHRRHPFYRSTPAERELIFGAGPMIVSQAALGRRRDIRDQLT